MKDKTIINIKKTMLTKLSVLFLGLVLVLTACGGNENAETGSETEASGQDPVKLGFTLSLTGNYAFMGEGVKEGIELYFEENDYKIGSRDVELLIEDDGGDPQKALQNYQQLTMNHQVDFFGGGVIGSIAYALTEAVEQDKQVPMINVVGSGNSLSWEDQSDYSWRIGFSSIQYAGTQGEDVAENIGETAVVVASDYVAGHEIATDFVANYEENGGEVLDVMWPASGTSDFSSYLSQIKQTDPEAVFFFFPGADGPRFIQQFKDFGLGEKYGLIDGSSVLNAPSTIESVGEDVVGGQTIAHYYPGLENDLNKQFVKSYEEKYSKTPDAYVVNGYDTGKLIAETIEQAGSTNSDDLVAALNDGISFDSPRGPITLDPDTNHPTQNLYILEGIEENGEVSFELLRTYEEVAMPTENPGYTPQK
ncbi:ABC transporter substrate-binding protein [Alteribacillus iranensis]|uniref:Branched-chain amino acid transport system substrate-binding protein n=1 Tax=Alteribacillus iranensis TaxID=930128 RepID=A0A1I2F061_9BACI|nr:ABC transporter substrate-binding protein [Alteribacillus iranensis]SFE98752.1 branched-chain amino acid transport system substrate-binding protein [Alteribacillus iranensis]